MMAAECTTHLNVCSDTRLDELWRVDGVNTSHREKSPQISLVQGGLRLRLNVADGIHAQTYANVNAYLIEDNDGVTPAGIASCNWLTATR